MLKIAKIQPDSLAEDAGLQASDKIISINDHPISDFLDLQFYSADETLSINFQNHIGEFKHTVIQQDWNIPIGIEPETHKCRTCVNDCVFCFVDQMPFDLRKSLYIKDDDFRLSFAFGNFITLTNLSKKDLKRIIEQKLSPLYISVHTTNPDLHRKMLRNKQDFNILEKLKFLSENGISLHTQIVIIPGWNDDKELASTLKHLTSPDLNVLSVGIVPVGLTKFRNSLTKIAKVNTKLAKDLLDISAKYSRTYCSDETYLLAGKDIPADTFYDDYPQLENGIGMLRMFSENWKINKDKFLKEIESIDNNLVFITGSLAFNFISGFAREINNILPGKSRTIKIKNNFFGESVTVTGLLTAKDIISQSDLKQNEIPVVSSNIFNDDGVTLDDFRQEKLCKKMNSSLFILDEEFNCWKLIQ